MDKLKRWRDACLIGLLLAHAAGCSGADPNDATGQGGGAGPNGGAGSAVGGTAASTGAGGTVGQGGSAGTNSNSVSIMLASLQQPSVSGLMVRPEFWVLTSPSQCTDVAKGGDCTLTECPAGAVTNQHHISAGTLSVTSSDPVVSLTLAPNTDGSYTTATADSIFFSGAPQQALLSATGAEIPAFSASIPVPLVLLLDGPTPQSGGRIVAPSTNDLTLTYSRGTSGVFLMVQGSTATRRLSCSSDSQLGSLTIGQSLLAGLGPTSLMLYSASVTQIPAGSWTVTAYFAMDVFTPDRTSIVSVTVQ